MKRQNKTDKAFLFTGTFVKYMGELIPPPTFFLSFFPETKQPVFFRLSSQSNKNDDFLSE